VRKGDVELSTNPLAFESARSEQAVGRDRPDSAEWEGGGRRGCLDGGSSAGEMERRLVKEIQKV